MATKKDKSVKLKEIATDFHLLQCIKMLGNLSVTLSGERKVMFKSTLPESHFTYYSVTLSGDQGCVFPLTETPCALDELGTLLSGIEPWMYQNDEEFEHYITDELKTWLSKTAIETIKAHFAATTYNAETVILEYLPEGEESPLVVMTVSAQSNPASIVIFEETRGCRYAGEVMHIGPIEEEPTQRRFTVKAKRKEENIDIDISEPYWSMGVVKIEDTKYLYFMDDNTPVVSQLILHNKKRGFIITDRYQSR